jgi:hypothetical protein
VTIQVWGSAAAIVAGSLLLGHGLRLLGFRCQAAAPAVGASLLTIIAAVAIKLPGAATTAAVVLAVLIVAAAVLTVLRREQLRFPLVSVAAGGIAALGAAIPFIANGRMGLLGVSLDNDTANHLIWAQALRSSQTRHIYGLPSGYPLGPHSVIATVSTGLGVRLDLSMTAFLIATVVIAAITGSRALLREAAWKRVVTGVLAALLYLVAAYYAEGAFKEQLLGLILLALVLQLEEVRREWKPGLWERFRVLAPAAVLVAASLYVYGYPAIAWIALTMAIWLVAEVALGPVAPRQWVARVRDLAPALIAGIVLLVVLLAPVIERNVNLFDTFGTSPSSTGAITASNLGNLAHPLSAYQALGIWQTPDFRFLPGDLFHQGELSALALAVLILGLVWALARRELVLPAAVAACAIVYWRATKNQSPYVTAKALVIAGPVIAVVGLRGLLRATGAATAWWVWGLRFAAAIAFVAFAAHSSYEVLRNEPVWPPQPTAQLLALAKPTRGQTVLDLVNTDYAEWLFNESYLSSIAGNTINLERAVPSASKPFVYGAATDFDSIQNLDRFRWVVTTNTPYASQAPAGFRLVRRLSTYELWERVGAVTPRRVIETSVAPGAVLNCRTGAGRALSRRRGTAAVMTAPVLKPLGTIPPGGTGQVTMSLPAGRWELSLQYMSAVNLELTFGGRRFSMPAYLDRPGPWFAVGPVLAGGGPVSVTIHADKPSFLTGPSLAALTTGLVATRIPDTRVLLPLASACGRYVDWYRL